MKRFELMLVAMIVLPAIGAAQGTSGNNDPVLKLDVVRVEAREVSPILVTKLHERFPDQQEVSGSLPGTSLLDTLSIDSFLPEDPFAPIQLPEIEVLLQSPASDGPILKPNN